MNQGTPAGLKLAVMAHMFHGSLFEIVKRKLSNIPQKVDLHLTTCSDQDEMALKQIFADWNGSVEIYRVDNRGRDIAPKLVFLRDAHAKYDLVLHLHTKFSDHGWRDHIYDRLLQSDVHVQRVIDTFKRLPRLGMLGGEHYANIKPWVGWGWNADIAISVLGRMGIKPEHIVGLDFPSGSMFWARPTALRPLFNLGLSIDDFPCEPLKDDGTLPHTIERLFYISCEAAGYTWGKISGRGEIQVRKGLQKLYYPNPLVRLFKGRKDRGIRNATEPK